MTWLFILGAVLSMVGGSLVGYGMASTTHRLLSRPAPEPVEAPDPVAVVFLTVPREVDCSPFSAGDAAVVLANTEDITEEQRDELDVAFTDALTLLNGPVPHVPGPYYPEE